MISHTEVILHTSHIRIKLEYGKYCDQIMPENREPNCVLNLGQNYSIAVLSDPAITNETNEQRGSGTGKTELD